MKKVVILSILALSFELVHAVPKGILSTVVPDSSSEGGRGSGWFHHLRPESLGGTHYGVDIGADPGSGVYPAYDGVIDDYIVVPSSNPSAHAYGNAVLIRHPQIRDKSGRELYSVYLHLDKLNPSLINGEDVKVDAGVTRLGGIGITGNAGDYYHTHFELRWFGQRAGKSDDWSHPTLNGSVSNLYYVIGDRDSRDLSISYTDWVSPEDVYSMETVPVHRFWNATSNAHFYTSSSAEAHATANDDNYEYEHAAYLAFDKPTPNSTPLYRFWSPTFLKHFYTASYDEFVSVRDNDDNWDFEGIAYYVMSDGASHKNTRTVFRFWSDLYSSHFYTASESERNHVRDFYPDNVWRYEGVVYNAEFPED